MCVEKGGGGVCVCERDILLYAPSTCFHITLASVTTPPLSSHTHTVIPHTLTHSSHLIQDLAVGLQKVR